ncbi:autotransporter domain-containing protein [Arhodomonas aquaeolei]|uniref:autotransporter family protein n=1 Tax=Arhodomonas aquaeolei TaxID=2369 RepID=UPI002168D92A|nr:autotransporter domain-containing protein [Arhodomonas aquaeolei]MCS4505860.1 autotransporter domain-containing protein [Arhodomonas aquaeolei]
MATGSDGSLTVSNGGSLETKRGFLGTASGADGTIAVTGSGTRFDVTSELTVGINGTGTFMLGGGASAEVNSLYVGSQDLQNDYPGGEGTGIVTVDGDGTVLRPGATTLAGEGTATMNVTGGATVSTGGTFTIASDSTGVGSLTVSGDGSEFVSTGFLNVGDNGTGSVTVTNRGSLTAAPILLGYRPRAEGFLLVDGPGTVVTAEDYLMLGYHGPGDATLRNDATIRITGGRGVVIGYGSNGTGTLNIGAARGDAPAAPGGLDATVVEFYEGGGSLIFNHTADGYAFDTPIRGSGTIRHLAGTTLLGADSAGFTGRTSVTGGTLDVTGTLGGTISVSAGGRLSGTGTVGTTTIGTDGAIAPGGDGIGSLTIDGDLDVSTGARYELQVVPGDGRGDRIDVAGSAGLDGGTILHLGLDAGSAYAPTSSYTVLTADNGIDGTFDSVTSDFAFLDPSLDYGTDDVTLTLARNDIDYADVANTPNQRAVGSAITAAANGPGNGVTPIVEAVRGMSASGARAAYDNLSGVQHTHNHTMTRNQQLRFRGLVFDHLGNGTTAGAGSPDNLRLAFAGRGWANALAASAATMNRTGGPVGRSRGLWVRAIGGTGRINGTDNASGYDYNSATLAIGADTRLASGITVGLAGSYGRTDVDTGNGDLDIDSYQIAGYAGWSADSSYVDTTLGVGRHQTDAQRVVTVGGDPRTASADYASNQLSWSIEGGHQWDWGDSAVVTPFLGADVSRTRREDFSESGAGTANLDVDEETTESLRTRVGVRLAGTAEIDGATIEPRAEFAWVREHGDRDTAMTAHFAPTPAATFEVNGPALDRDRAAIGFGVTARIDQASRLDLEYRGEFAESDRHHGIALTWRMRW